MHTSTNRHTVDMFFVITLFGVFALCASLLIAYGARIYNKTLVTNDTHYTLTTTRDFITEKLHQHDESGCIHISDFGGQSAFLLYEQVDDVRYCNYIYYYDGYLKDLFVPEGTDVSPRLGQNILELADFSVKEKNNTTADDGTCYEVSITDVSGDKVDFNIFTHSSR
ncbi:MAG: DUF4860 domain-containing protein [Lachnospiraceae bacterium]|nr:DUF4860 domain-containing protein [Candidatus Colinaster equi]